MLDPAGRGGDRSRSRGARGTPRWETTGCLHPAGPRGGILGRAGAETKGGGRADRTEAEGGQTGQIRGSAITWEGLPKNGEAAPAQVAQRQFFSEAHNGGLSCRDLSQFPISSLSLRPAQLHPSLWRSLFLSPIAPSYLISLGPGSGL